jgi:LysM repeat protein
MNRSQLAFVILVNAAISLVIALAVVWLFEMRRPDAEELAALYGPGAGAILAATPTVAEIAVLPTPPAATPETIGAGGGEPDVQTAQAAASTGDETVHIVEAGESLGSIATRYGVTIDALVQANSLANPDFVFSGQRLVIPGNGGGTSTGAASQGNVQILALEGAGNLAQEAVLIANESNTPFNLTGWELIREGGPTYTFGNVQLFPGSSVRVYSAAGEDNSIALYWGQTEALWTPGSSGRLRNAAGVDVDTITAEAGTADP